VSWRSSGGEDLLEGDAEPPKEEIEHDRDNEHDHGTSSLSEFEHRQDT
jgi:hypothetical protein